MSEHQQRNTPCECTGTLRCTDFDAQITRDPYTLCMELHKIGLSPSSKQVEALRGAVFVPFARALTLLWTYQNAMDDCSQDAGVRLPLELVSMVLEFLVYTERRGTLTNRCQHIVRPWRLEHAWLHMVVYRAKEVMNRVLQTPGSYIRYPTPLLAGYSIDHPPRITLDLQKVTGPGARRYALIQKVWFYADVSVDDGIDLVRNMYFMLYSREQMKHILGAEDVTHRRDVCNALANALRCVGASWSVNVGVTTSQYFNDYPDTTMDLAAYDTGTVTFWFSVYWQGIGEKTGDLCEVTYPLPLVVTSECDFGTQHDITVGRFRRFLRALYDRCYDMVYGKNATCTQSPKVLGGISDAIVSLPG